MKPEGPARPGSGVRRLVYVPHFKHPIAFAHDGSVTSAVIEDVTYVLRERGDLYVDVLVDETLLGSFTCSDAETLSRVVAERTTSVDQLRILYALARAWAQAERDRALASQPK